jgi:hypothetical protein
MAKNRNFPIIFDERFSSYKEICPAFYGMHGGVHLWSYIKQALLCNSVADNRKFLQLLVDVSQSELLETSPVVYGLNELD